MSVSTARADVPACSGNNVEEAATSLQKSKAIYADAAKLGASDAARTKLLEQALDLVDSACRDGEVGGLRRRVTILVALHRWLEAGQSLDAYMKAAGDRKLEADEQHNFDAVRSVLEKNVATVHVAAAPTAHVSLDGALIGTGEVTVHTTAGAHYLKVESDDGARDEDFVLSNGQRHELDARVQAQANIVAHVDMRAPNAPVTETKRPFTPWIVGFGVATGVFAGVGIAAALWADNRAQTINKSCLGPSPLSGCDAVRTEYDSARGLEVGMFAAAGLATIATGVFVYLQLQKPRTKAVPIACAVMPTTIGCLGTF